MQVKPLTSAAITTPDELGCSDRHAAPVVCGALSAYPGDKPEAP